MFLHHDLSWWAFVLSVAAIVSAYPLSLLANLTSPAIKNWWAERSVTSTRARIEKLEKQLADYEQSKELSELEDWALQAIEGIGTLGMVCVEILAVALLLTAATLPGVAGPSRPDIRPGLVILGLLSAFMGLLFQFLIFDKLRRFRLKQSPSVRNGLRKSLEQLTAKLGRMK